MLEKDEKTKIHPFLVFISLPFLIDIIDLQHYFLFNLKF